ncbi:hypothetical protein [Bradyrhizobium sp.]|uniref:hypothetical protein n=1 Tax=Bradyrhizobium sp. TaxID=376 RepID=UPI001EBF0B6A|nr:hypothetical protein [Bradyrhizobium sp.]MBV8892407.1 hypothetical protein [Acidobacteriota bacterium]MBV9484230.1 hypothetical protein [Acidobacteriota bacterium]MBV9985913.1 hypothetical protein [Bradyrhizobium sp.]
MKPAPINRTVESFKSGNIKMSTPSQNPGRCQRVHLWIYNHSFFGISDQIEYFVQSFQQNGYSTSVGREPSGSALNVVIENFSALTRDTLVNFCSRTRKRVAVIMTEHIDFLDRRIFIHGDPLWSANDYMHPATQTERLRCLMSCQPYIKFFMVLGDLPELRNFADVMIGADIRAIPFPKIDRVANSGIDELPQPSNDLLFTGFVTEYREKLLPELGALGFSVVSPRRFVSRKRRDQLNRSAKIVLNIPQRERWRWLSLMRVIAALRCGRATVSLGTDDTSRIAACTYQLDIRDSHWKEGLKAYVAGWPLAYEKAYEAYCRLTRDFERECPFPHDMMEYWAITDRV